jgi:hypothetical protein
LNLFPRRKPWYKRRRRRLPAAILVALVLLAGAAYVVTSTRDGTANLSGSSGRDTPSQTREEARSEGVPTKGSDQGEPPPEETAPDPEQDSPEAAAYVALAPELPGTTPQSIKGVYRSKIDESWASVRVQPENEGKPFVVFTHKDGESWRAEKSVRADEPNYAKNDVVPLSGVPKDLIEYLYTENVFAAEVPEPKVEKLNLEDLPDAGPAEFSSTEPVMDGVPESDRKSVV